MANDAILETNLKSLPFLHRGKVRDLYAVGDDKLLVVQTDRLSAFDVILSEPIPGKGAVLTEMSYWWFNKLGHVIPNHLTGIAPETVVAANERDQVAGRSMVVHKFKPLMTRVERDRIDAMIDASKEDLVEEQKLKNTPKGPLAEDPIAAEISFDDFVARKITTTSLMAERILPELLKAASGSNDADVQAATALLAGWDHRYEPDSRGALLFETWAGIFSPRNFTDQSNYAVKWTLDDPLETPRGLRDPVAAVAMLKQAVAKTKQLYGAIDRPFGDVSRFHIGNVNVPANGGFGNTGVFRTITWGPMKNGERTPVHGETWVSMVEFGTPMKAIGLMSYGNSSQPGSKHNSDQLQLLEIGRAHV